MIPEVVMQTSKRGRQSSVPPSYDANEPYQQQSYHNNPKGTVVAYIMEVTNSSPIEHNIHSTRGKICLVLKH